MNEYDTVDANQLRSLLEKQAPDNASRDAGVALVNVLPEEKFSEEHIPHSINIPTSNIEEFVERFDKEKEIVVYCASPECNASEKAAEELSKRGFSHVTDFSGGMSEWKAAGERIATGGQ